MIMVCAFDLWKKYDTLHIVNIKVLWQLWLQKLSKWVEINTLNYFERYSWLRKYPIDPTVDRVIQNINQHVSLPTFPISNNSVIIQFHPMCSVYFSFIFSAHENHNFRLYNAHIRNITQKKSIWRECGTLRKIKDGMPHVSDYLNDKYSTAMPVYFVWWMRSHPSAPVVFHYLFWCYIGICVFVCNKRSAETFLDLDLDSISEHFLRQESCKKKSYKRKQFPLRFINHFF